ncbi:MAG: hypothetical protein JW725_04230 [Candidatus Babeliaceae bacterium]|nr:hypothetical protein [Candidatus Babeliaceae bacterium]
MKRYFLFLIAVINFLVIPCFAVNKRIVFSGLKGIFEQINKIKTPRQFFDCCQSLASEHDKIKIILKTMEEKDHLIIPKLTLALMKKGKSLPIPADYFRAAIKQEKCLDCYNLSNFLTEASLEKIQMFSTLFASCMLQRYQLNELEKKEIVSVLQGRQFGESWSGTTYAQRFWIFYHTLPYCSTRFENFENSNCLSPEKLFNMLNPEKHLPQDTFREYLAAYHFERTIIEELHKQNQEKLINLDATFKVNYQFLNERTGTKENVSLQS